MMMRRCHSTGTSGRSLADKNIHQAEWLEQDVNAVTMRALGSCRFSSKSSRSRAQPL